MGSVNLMFFGPINKVKFNLKEIMPRCHFYGNITNKYVYEIMHLVSCFDSAMSKENGSITISL